MASYAEFHRLLRASCAVLTATAEYSLVCLLCCGKRQVYSRRGEVRLCAYVCVCVCVRVRV